MMNARMEDIRNNADISPNRNDIRNSADMSELYTIVSKRLKNKGRYYEVEAYARRRKGD